MTTQCLAPEKDRFLLGTKIHRMKPTVICYRIYAFMLIPLKNLTFLAGCWQNSHKRVSLPRGIPQQSQAEGCEPVTLQESILPFPRLLLSWMRGIAPCWSSAWLYHRGIQEMRKTWGCMAQWGSPLWSVGNSLLFPISQLRLGKYQWDHKRRLYLRVLWVLSSGIPGILCFWGYYKCHNLFSKKTHVLVTRLEFVPPHHNPGRNSRFTMEQSTTIPLNCLSLDDLIGLSSLYDSMVKGKAVTLQLEACTSSISCQKKELLTEPEQLVEHSDFAI